MTHLVHRLSFYTSYRQFYVMNPDVRYDTGDPEFWTKEASERGLAVGPGALGVGTASYGHVRCFWELADAEPTLALSPWQRVTEASIQLASGRYALLDCPDSKVIHEDVCPPGDYRLRVYSAFLDELVEGTAGDDYFDFYWLVLWAAPYEEPRTLKAYNRVEMKQDPSVAG